MSWNEEYNRLNKPWGEQPSELAVLAMEYLRKNAHGSADPTLLDIGCGYAHRSWITVFTGMTDARFP
jgi:hypothetical protein